MHKLKIVFLTHIRLILLIQLFCLAATGLFAIKEMRHPHVINIDAKSIEVTDSVTYNDSFFLLEDSKTESEDWTDAISAYRTEWAPGSYTLIIDYESSCDRPFFISDINNVIFKGTLRSYNRSEMYKFNTPLALDTLKIAISSKYSEDDFLRLSSISVVSNADPYKRAFFILLISFIFMDILFPFTISHHSPKSLYVMFALLGLATVSSLPLFLSGIAENGHDLFLHLMHLETVYTDLKRGAFPVRINSSAIFNYGYPVSLFNGDLYLYPFAIMRAFGFTINEAFKSLLFAINVLTVLSAYLCFKKIAKGRYTALIMTCVYVMAPYRLTNLYIRNAIEESAAAVILPVIALAVYRIYDTDPDKNGMKRASNLLALGMAALMCTHVPSFGIIMLLLIAHTLIFYKKTFSKKTLHIISLSVVKTVLLSAYFMIPYLDIVISDPVRFTDTVNNKIKLIQKQGIFLSDLFMITHSEFRDRYPLTPGIILILTLAIAVIMTVARKIKKDKVLKYYIFITIVLLFASTRMFPWNYLATDFPGMVSRLQFPFRLLMPATLYLTLLLGHMLDRYFNSSYLKRLTVIILSFGFITASLFAETYERETLDSRIVYYNTSDVDSRSVGSGEYLRVNTLVHTLDAFDKPDELVHQENGDLVSSYNVDGTGMILECNGLEFPIDIIVPKYNYKGYRVFDDQGNECETKDSLYDLLAFKLPAGYNGLIHVKYIEPRYWRVAEVITLIFLIYLIYNLYQHKKESLKRIFHYSKECRNYLLSLKKKMRKESRQNRKLGTKKTIEWSLYLLVTSVLTFLSFALAWAINNFSMVTFSGIVFTLRMPFSDAGEGMISGFIVKAVIPAVIVISIIISVFIIRIRKTNLSNTRHKLIRLLFPIISIIWLCSLVFILDRKFDVRSYLNSIAKQSAFIETEYVDPEQTKLEFPGQKRNLIYIFIESAETSLIDREHGGVLGDHNYIPEMTALLDENVDFSQNELHKGAAVSPASGWTVAGMVAELSGLPLKMYAEDPVNVDNSMNQYEYFMPGATMLGDILEKEGYHNYFMCGSDIVFGGRENLLKQHGNYEIFDFKTAKEEGKIPTMYHVFWGFEDLKLYEYAKEKITLLSQEEEPFNFTMLTVDTHHPNGYICPSCNPADCSEEYGQVWHCASRQIYSFIEWCKTQPWYDDTTIVICGDHCSMAVDFFKDHTYDKYGGETARSVYNCFINSSVEPVNANNRLFTTMDIFPTTLASMGVEIDGDRLGLGTNLFSGRKTLAEEYGYDKLFEELEYKSDFYDNKLLYP